MKSFLDHYRETLIALRRGGGAFARKYPEIADALDLKDGESADPQTERIIESVAFMAAKIEQKIDDNVQSVAFHLLAALYPNLVSPFPPCGIVRFDSSVKISNPDRVSLPKGTSLFAGSKQGTDCAFRTVYPISLYPVEITHTEITTFSGISNEQFIEVKMATVAVPFEQLDIDDVLLYINSEILEDAMLVYESIFLAPEKNAFAKIGNSRFRISGEDIVQCGFGEDETVCPVHKYTSNVFQLFQEALHFKRKFMFFRILNLDRLIRNSGLQGIAEISILLKISMLDEKLLNIVKPGIILMNAVPIVNLFKVTSDPFRFDGTKNRYLLMSDQSLDRSIEVHSVHEVMMVDSNAPEPRVIQPYFSLAVDSDTNIIHDIFWTYTRESSEIRGLDGFDTYVSFVETRMDPRAVYSSVVYATLLCTNRFETRDIPSLVRMGIENVDSAGYSGTLLHKMTPPMSLIDDNDSLWNLISQISATHISAASGESLLASFSKLIEIFACGVRLKQSDSLDEVAKICIGKTARRIGRDAWRGFVSGLIVEVLLEGDELTPNKFLLFSVLNQYLSSSISINSFVELVLKSGRTNRIITRWPPTSGRRELL
jgi:type VI secretion system protein ImpG